MGSQVASPVRATEADTSVPVPIIPNVLEKRPGFYALYPDVSVNFQLNRWLAWMTPEALPDVAKVAAEARGYANLTTSFLLLADRVVQERRLLAPEWHRPEAIAARQRSMTPDAGDRSAELSYRELMARFNDQSPDPQERNIQFITK